MSVTLGINIPSIKAQNQLQKASRNLSVSMERLSSGLRINNASDDPAGLAVATKLKSDSRVFLQGIRNVNDTISLLNIAESAGQRLTTILQRIEELATQAANETYTSDQRSALNKEATALQAEYNRIAATTKFNNKALLDGTFGTNHAQAGYGTQGAIQYDIGIQSVSTEGTGDFTASGLYSPVLGFYGTVNYGDLNNDGNIDIVVASGGTPDEYTLLGNGDGTFQAPLAGPAFNVNYEFELADVNGDGYLDALAVNNTTLNLMVSMGVGNGTFGAITNYATGGTNLSRIDIGDFNEDGFEDVALTSSGDDTIRVMFGNSNGSFKASVSFATGDQSVPFLSDIVVGDFNGDGNQDLASTDTNEGRFTVLLGTGTGTFGARVSTFVNAYGSIDNISVGDFNNDGRDDLVNYEGAFLSNGDGTLTAAHDLFAGFGVATYSAVADFNNDGFDDILRGGSTAYMLIGNGDGTFSIAETFSLGVMTNIYQLTAADINNDSVPDAIFATNGVGVRTFVQGSISSDVVELNDVDISTVASARSTLTYVSSIRETIQLGIGRIGAHLSRMEVAMQNLISTQANLERAATFILDADIAEETANMVKSKVLAKAATAVLAQANQNPKIALKLLL